MFEKLKMRRKLQNVGACVDTSYLLYINNEQPITFALRNDLMSYVQNFRNENPIFKLQIYRIETYSL